MAGSDYYRILAQNFLEGQNCIFVIGTTLDKQCYSGTAWEIMCDPIFEWLHPRDIAQIVYTFAEERFAEEMRVTHGSGSGSNHAEG